MKKTIYLATLALALAGCASNPPLGNVVPQPGGVYQATGIGESNDAAMASALYTADTTCKPLKKHHVVTGQQTEYKGIVSESTNKTVNAAAEAINGLTGAVLPTLSTDDDYRVTLTFTCEA